MADSNGWIKLHRKLLDNPIVMKDSEYLAVWIYLLLNASHAEYPVLFGGKKITLQPGQLITGRKSIASELCISESKVRRILDMFETDQQIDRQRSNKNSLVSIKNWDKYQICDRQNDQQLTNNRPTTDQQPTTNKKNNKKIKEDKEIIYSDSQELNEAILSFIEYRKSIKKPMSERAVSLLLGKLNKMSGSIQEQIEILNQSILNGWQGIFPLKNESGNRVVEQIPSYTKKNKFNSFPQRKYDMEALEQALLNTTERGNEEGES
nr:MAG TPA: replisome organizer [Caudoviricetes sp.]